ncbi:hypothetical protein LB505_010384 [Fusarium chuoi]|nr:hypothetical protein LB505_010384 [Fusarium chuoi]
MGSTNFDGTSESFLHWFKSLPDATFSDAIKIVDLRDRNAGRGIRYPCGNNSVYHSEKRNHQC